MLLTSYTPSPWDSYVAFEPPAEFSFQSRVADESYLACGWLRGAQCYVMVRYRNYVTYVILDLEGEYEGRVSRGLTYEEIEAVVEAMDAKFVAFLAGLSSMTPTPQPQ